MGLEERAGILTDGHYGIQAIERPYNIVRSYCNKRWERGTEGRKKEREGEREKGRGGEQDNGSNEYGRWRERDIDREGVGGGGERRNDYNGCD